MTQPPHGTADDVAERDELKRLGAETVREKHTGPPAGFAGFSAHLDRTFREPTTTRPKAPDVVGADGSGWLVVRQHRRTRHVATSARNRPPDAGHKVAQGMTARRTAR